MKRPIRVLHILEATTAGVRRYTQSLVTHLDRERFSVEVACPPVRQDAYGDVAFVEVLRAASIPVHPVPLRRSIGVHDLVGLRAVYRVIRAGRYDLVHTHSSKAGFLGRLAARLGGVPVVHTPNAFHFLGVTGPARAFYLGLERLAGRFTDRLIVVSRSEQEIVRRYGLVPPRRVALIENAVDVEAIRRAAAPDRAALRERMGLGAGPVIGSVGRLMPQKDPLTFLEVARRVHARLPEARFLWCGDGPLRGPVTEAARQMEVPLVLTGHREDVWTVMSLFDLFLLTSRYEGLPFSLLEAMALGIPVVATDVVGNRDALLDGELGMLVPVGDVEAIAAGVLACLEHPDEAQARAERAATFVTRHRNLPAFVARHEKLYAEVVGGPSPPARR